jgi:hypothetical protein
MNTVAGREDLQVNVCILHFPKVLTLLLPSVCEQKNVHIHLTGD